MPLWNVARPKCAVQFWSAMRQEAMPFSTALAAVNYPYSRSDAARRCGLSRGFLSFFTSSKGVKGRDLVL